MTTTLYEMTPGKKGRILKIAGKGMIKKRIVDMGMVPGAEIEVERYAPLGDPIEIKVKGYHLSLRKEDASLVLIELI